MSCSAQTADGNKLCDTCMMKILNGLMNLGHPRTGMDFSIERVDLPHAELTARTKYLARMETVRSAFSYLASVCFMVIASWLIMYAPRGREVAADVISAALLLLAAGIAGFTSFFAKLPEGIEIKADRDSGAN